MNRAHIPRMLALLVLAAGGLGQAADAPSESTPQPAAASAQAPDRGQAPAHAAVSDEVLAQLDSDDWSTREQAAARLLADASLAPADVARAYLRAVSAEQRYRLLQVARHHLVRRWVEHWSRSGTAAALGVRMGSEDSSPDALPGVPVVGVFVGFPAYGRLYAGDVIVALDGQALSDAAPGRTGERLRQLIQERAPGQVVRLTVRRGEHGLELAVPLAGSAALNVIHEPQSGSLRAPFDRMWDLFHRRLEAGQMPLDDEPPGSAVPDPSVPVESPLPAPVE